MIDVLMFMFVFFKQKTAYEMRISDWSSDVCSSDLYPQEQRGMDRVRRGSHPASRRQTSASVHPSDCSGSRTGRLGALRDARASAVCSDRMSLWASRRAHR